MQLPLRSLGPRSGQPLELLEKSAEQPKERVEQHWKHLHQKVHQHRNDRVKHRFPPWCWCSIPTTPVAAGAVVAGPQAGDESPSRGLNRRPIALLTSSGPSREMRCRVARTAVLRCHTGVMCRNITILRGLEPPANETEIRAAALQYVRKVGGLGQVSAANQAAVDRAVAAIAAATLQLLDDLPDRRQPPKSEPPLRRIARRSL